MTFTKYFIVILATLLFIFETKVMASLMAHSYRASEQDAPWIKACSDACKDFRTVFHQFTANVNTDTWLEAYKAFTTCQWRCYRCSLSTGVAGMEVIESVSSNFNIPQNVEIVKKYKSDINLSSFICRDKWIVASELGCSKDPVETVDPTCNS